MTSRTILPDRSGPCQELGRRFLPVALLRIIDRSTFSTTGVKNRNSFPTSVSGRCYVHCGKYFRTEAVTLCQRLCMDSFRMKNLSHQYFLFQRRGPKATSPTFPIYLIVRLSERAMKRPFWGCWRLKRLGSKRPEPIGKTFLSRSTGLLFTRSHNWSERCTRN